MTLAKQLAARPPRPPGIPRDCLNASVLSKLEHVARCGQMSLEIVKNYEIYMLKAERSIFRTMNRHEQCNVAVTEADAGSKAKVGTPYATTLNPSVSRGFQLLCGTLLNIRPRRGEFHESLLAAANPGTAAFGSEMLEGTLRAPIFNSPTGTITITKPARDF